MSVVWLHDIGGSYAFTDFPTFPHIDNPPMNAIRAAENGPCHAVVFDELKKLDYPAERLTEARFFIEAFFERIAPADHALHAPARWAALIADRLAFARERTPGKAKVRVYNPGVSGTRAVVEVVTDDMPFLVDTVSMVAAAHADIHAIIHPVVPVVRSSSGALEAMGTGEKTESIMRFEIDRIDDTELDVVKANVYTALSDVREAVDDWRAMRGKMVEIADDLGKRALPYTAEEVREASEFLRWVADEHFTFMGYREYEVAADAGDEVLKTVEGSGLGILRAGGQRAAAFGFHRRHHPHQDQRPFADAPRGLHGLRRRPPFRRQGPSGRRAALPRPVLVQRIHGPSAARAARAREVRGRDDPLGPQARFAFRQGPAPYPRHASA